jgi:hypothetical protein
MSREWIKMRTNLWDDPRITRICELTDQSEAAIVGSLYWLWSTADQHSIDGIVPALSIRQIDRKTGVSGFGDALVSVGWLADHPDGVRIVKFEEHNGKSAKVRAQTAKRVSSHAGKQKLTQPALVNEHEGVSVALEQRYLEEEEEEEEEVSQKHSNPNGLLVISDADDVQKSGKPTCPHKEIIAVYHEILPACPRIRDWTPARQTMLRARWNEDDKRQNIAWWRNFFEYVASCDFLVGKVSSHGNRPFFADLPWLLKAENFAKVREGRYEPN